MLEFITLSDELVPLATKLISHMEEHGYTIRIEPSDISFPSTPTISARREHQRLYIIVVKQISAHDVEMWVRYCTSCPNDSRIAFCIIDNDAVSAAELAKYMKVGVGIISLNAETLLWLTEPRDIAFHAALPERGTLKPHVRRLLGEALDRFDNKDWRTGFENACLVLEDESRKYLLRNATAGRVSYRDDRGKVKTPTKKKIRKMTLGALKIVFCNLLQQNQIESIVCSAIDKLNPERIRRIHGARRHQTESALRRQVGTQMWSIINALSAFPVD